MRRRSTYLVCLTFLVAGILALLPTKGHAQLSVERGWDLFTTAPGTSFVFPVVGLTPMVGVPLGTFDFTTGTGGDFGRGIGIKAVGSTDTIIKRLAVASVGSTPATAPTIGLEMVALHLRTAAPIDIGAGSHFYFITLQSERGGTLTTFPPSSMDITFSNPSGGTFNSFFDVFFDIRQDSLAGPIVQSTDLTLSSSSTPWSHTPIAGELLINGVNNLLNGTNTLADFHVASVLEQHPGNAVHQAQFTQQSTAAPEPGPMGLLAFGLLIGIARRRRA